MMTSDIQLADNIGNTTIFKNCDVNVQSLTFWYDAENKIVEIAINGVEYKLSFDEFKSTFYELKNAHDTSVELNKGGI